MMEFSHIDKLTNIPLSADQRRLWIIYQQDKSNPAYNLVLTYHIKGSINIGIFKKSLEILFKKQHTLFSVFKHKEGIPFIEIIPRPVKPEIIDFSDYPISSRRKKILSFAGEDTRKPFNLEKGPLYRLYLLKQDNTNYYFHATIHHIVFDGWSMKLFIKQLEKNYNNLINCIDKTPDTIKYHNYEIAAIDKQPGRHNKELIEYWKSTFKGYPPEMKFPYDYQRKEQLSGHGKREPLFICETTTNKLKKMSNLARTSMFKTMLSAIGVLFYKYSGENDICIGFPISNRQRDSSMEEIIGFFVRTSVIRMIINENNNFQEILNYTKEITNKAIENSRLSFDKIIESVNPVRKLNVNSLFQVSLSWWNNITVPIKLNGNIAERVYLPKGVSPFDISFYLWEKGNHIEGEIEYSTDLLKRDTILRMKKNFLSLLDNLIEYPGSPIESLPMICDEEKKMIYSINQTRNEYPKDKTIVQLFEEQVNLYPDKKAVVFKESFLTYEQLNEKANQLARTLRQTGVNRNIPVALIMDKSVKMIVSILGILKAGGAYLPIDPKYPDKRINFIIKETGCRILLTQYKYMKITVEVEKKIDLESFGSFPKKQGNITNVNNSSDLAYFIYTSGTTGVPKGSMIRHFSVVRLVRNINYMELTPNDRLLFTSAMVFDVSTFELWASLLNGMTLFIAEKETILDPKTLGDICIKNKISILHLTSALFTEIAEVRTDFFTELKYLMVGGDIISAYHVNKVREDNPELKVINCYGPSENTTFSTTFIVDKTFDHNIPIGKPVSNSTVYIFDKHLNYQPIGVIGEIYVGGDGLSIGYLNSDLNKISFIDHPNIPGERLYKTGDFGKWLPDGNIEFYGRSDSQIKIRGFRVELEEVELILAEIEGIVETVVKPFKVVEGDLRLIAFLRVLPTFKKGIKEINRQVKKRLPFYMIPYTYIFLDKFPKNINGKIDRKELIYTPEKLEAKEKHEALDLSPVEKLIFNIWQDALNKNDFDLVDNFFDIGGNSLLAISIFSKIKSTFKIDMELRVFFEGPSIKDLAQTVELALSKMTSKENDVNKEIDGLELISGEL